MPTMEFLERAAGSKDMVSDKRWTDAHLNEVLTYLRAWPMALIQTALKIWRTGDRIERLAEGWAPFVGTVADVPAGMEWRLVGTKVHVRQPRPPEPVEQQTESARRKIAEAQAEKPDLSASKIEDLACPLCASGLYKEGVCPGCEDGKRGFKIRLMCGECDFTMLL